MRATAAALLMLTDACATIPHEPPTGPHLSIESKVGGADLYRDGQHFDLGVFHGGLAEAVAPVPAAVEAAHRSHRDIVMFYVLGGAGLLASTGAGALVASGTPAENASVTTPRMLGSMALLGGSVAALAGMFVYIFQSGDALYEAIDTYNAAVDAGATTSTSLPVPAARVGAK